VLLCSQLITLLSNCNIFFCVFIKHVSHNFSHVWRPVSRQFPIWRPSPPPPSHTTNGMTVFVLITLMCISSFSFISCLSPQIMSLPPIPLPDAVIYTLLTATAVPSDGLCVIQNISCSCADRLCMTLKCLFSFCFLISYDLPTVSRPSFHPLHSYPSFPPTPSHNSRHDGVRPNVTHFHV
jgi:hypothetical protein